MNRNNALVYPTPPHELRTAASPGIAVANGFATYYTAIKNSMSILHNRSDNRWRALQLILMIISAVDRPRHCIYKNVMTCLVFQRRFTNRVDVINYCHAKQLFHIFIVCTTVSGSQCSKSSINSLSIKAFEFMA